MPASPPRLDSASPTGDDARVVEALPAGGIEVPADGWAVIVVLVLAVVWLTVSAVVLWRSRHRPPER